MIRWLSGRNALIAMVLSALLPMGGTAMADIDVLNLLDPKREFSRVGRAYGDMDARYVRVGTPRSLAQVRSIAIGESKQDLQGAIGRPAFAHSDGSWEFHLALPLTQRDSLICQYRVYFDAGERVKGTVWRRPQCADLISSARN